MTDEQVLKTLIPILEQNVGNRLTIELIQGILTIFRNKINLENQTVLDNQKNIDKENYNK